MFLISFQFWWSTYSCNSHHIWPRTFPASLKFYCVSSCGFLVDLSNDWCPVPAVVLSETFFMHVGSYFIIFRFSFFPVACSWDWFNCTDVHLISFSSWKIILKCGCTSLSVHLLMELNGISQLTSWLSYYCVVFFFFSRISLFALKMSQLSCHLLLTLWLPSV